MAGFSIRLETTLHTRVREFRRTGILKFTRLEYAALAQVIRFLIIRRTRDFYLDVAGNPFAEYSPGTLKKKKPLRTLEAVEPLDRVARIIDALVARLKANKADPKQVKALRASIGHFWREFNQMRDELYASAQFADDRQKVNLTDSGEMLNTLKAVATKNFCQISSPLNYAKWISRGVPSQRVTKKKQKRGTLPARPFVGYTEAEARWLREKFILPILENFIQIAMAAIFGGERVDQIPPSEIANKMLRKPPTKSEEQKG